MLSTALGEVQEPIPAVGAPFGPRIWGGNGVGNGVGKPTEKPTKTTNRQNREMETTQAICGLSAGCEQREVNSGQETTTEQRR